MKTLVTGGNGFIGRNTVAELLRRGRDVVVLDQHGVRPGGYEEQQGDGSVLVSMPEVILGDIRDATAVTEAMAHADSWIHLAGVLGTQETIGNPLPAAETNVLGGLNVLQAAAQYGLPGVNIGVGNWFEDNTYSLTKHTIERFCGMYRRFRGLPVTVVRALNAYGPGQSVAAPYGPSKVRKIMPSFVMRALHHDPIEIYGDGQQVMDMVYVTDVAEVLVDALEWTEQHGAYNGVLEAGTGRPTTVLEIAETVIREVHSPGVIAMADNAITHLAMRPGETPGGVVLANPERLADIGRQRQFVPLELGVARTVAYYREQLAGTGGGELVEQTS
jgi:UDP-glucose 4-epimerase